jgi:hypothetical protein
VTEPAGGAPDGKGRCEERNIEADAVQQQRRVELDVGLQAASRLVLLE